MINFEKYGLTKLETLILTCCIESSGESPTGIAQLTKLKRSTLYPYLDKLIESNLLVRVKRGNRFFYDTPKPTLLVNALKEHRAAAMAYEDEELIKQLGKMKFKNKGEAFVHFKDPKAFKLVFNDILSSRADFFWIGSFKFLTKYITTQEIYKSFTLKRMNTFTKAYSISDGSIFETKKLSEELGDFRKMKVLKNLDMEAIACLYLNKIVLAWEDGGKPEVVILENDHMSKLLKILFKKVWQSLA